MGIFLFKELGYISGFLVVFAVLVLLLFLTLELSPLILIVYLAFMSNKGTLFVFPPTYEYGVT